MTRRTGPLYGYAVWSARGQRAPAAGYVLPRGSLFARKLVRRRRDEGVEIRNRQPRRRPYLHVQLIFEGGMDNEIISYIEMCQRESSSLQRGMNFELGAGYSVILMSVHPNAPYRDRFEDDGSTVIYEGHDAPRSRIVPDPKAIDQPECTPAGTLTENGRFYRSALQYKSGGATPKTVRVYEKIRQGIWSYNGVFHLVHAWREHDGQRMVFKFKLSALESANGAPATGVARRERRRLIPTSVKMEVWRRDGGKCVVCGATDELHFDHDLPYSLGGTSVTAENVQLLCVRHNLSKGAKIL
jgi:hypothetical protein